VHKGSLTSYDWDGGDLQINPFIAERPFSAPASYNPPIGVVSSTPALLSFPNIEAASRVSEEICIANTGAATVDLNKGISNRTFVSSTFYATSLTGGQQICGDVTVDTSVLSPGQSFSASITISSSANSVVIPISGTVAQATSAPEPPRITSVESLDGGLRVRFESGDDGGLSITSYRVTCGDVTVTTSDSSALISGLENGSEVTCSVTATNSNATSESSASVIATPGGEEQIEQTGLPIWLIYEAIKN
tara:strand:- start:70 stop:816 length:747 start_codon:yes stop_codon:yes gene_type:complete